MAEHYMLESDSDDALDAEVPALTVASFDLTVGNKTNGFSGVDEVHEAPLPVVSPLLQAEAVASSSRDSWLEQRHPDVDTGTTSIDYESWLNEVYAVHKPDNVGQAVAAILDKFRGRENEMVAFICDKYSIGPPGPEFGGSGEAVGAADVEINVSADMDDSAEPDYCELIREVYKEVNPDKIGDVSSLLAKYAGKERALYLAICEKYKVEPHQAAVDAASAAETVSSSPRDAAPNDAASEKQAPEAPEVAAVAAPAPAAAPAAAPSAAAEPARPTARLGFGLIPQRFRRSPPKDPVEDSKAQQTEDGDCGQQQQQDKKLREEAMAEVLRAQKERDEAFEGLTEVQEILGEANWRLALVSDESCAAQQEVARLEAVLAESHGTEECHERHAEEVNIADVYKKAAKDHQEECEQLQLKLKQLEQLSNTEERDASLREQMMEQQRVLQRESSELNSQIDQLKAVNSDLVQRNEQEVQKTDREIEILRSEVEQARTLAQEQRAETLRAEAVTEAEKLPGSEMEAVRQAASEAQEQISRLQQEARQQRSQAQQAEEMVAQERDRELERVAQLQAELVELRQRAEEQRVEAERSEALGQNMLANEAHSAQQLNAKLASELDELRGLVLQEQQSAAQMAEEVSTARKEAEHLHNQCHAEAGQATAAANIITEEQHAAAEREVVAERLRQQLHLAAEATEEEKRKVERLREEQHAATEQEVAAERLSQQLHLAAEATEEEKKKVEQLHEEVSALKAESMTARNGELALRAELQEQLKMQNPALAAALREDLSSNGSGAEQ